MTKPKEDLTGKKYGRLLVLGQADDYVYPNGKTRTRWKCLCDCGNVVNVEQSNLKRGNSNSCGCLNDELIATRSIKHGDKHSRLYNIWTNMKDRCYNEKSKNYKRYGARGISICAEWKDSYMNFKNWAIENGYNNEVSIDRIDVNGDYEPSNCRWADAKHQANNRRNTIIVNHDGQSKSLSEWADELGVKYHTLFARIFRLGWDVDRALSIQ